MGKKPLVPRDGIEKVRCVWGVLCSLSSIDQEKNNISLFNVIDQISLPKDFFEQQRKEEKALIFPLQHEIVLCWKRVLDVSISDEEILADVRIKTFDPSRVVLQEMINQIKLPKGKKILRHRIIVPSMPASLPGGYVHQIEIRLQDQAEFKNVHGIPFEIKEQGNVF